MDITSRGKINYPPRMLKIRRTFHWSGIIVLTSIVAFTIFLLLSGAYYFYYIDGMMLPINVSIGVENAFHCMIYSSLFLIVLSIFYWYFFKDVMWAKFQASQHHLICHKRNKEFKIYFQEVISLHCRSFGPLYLFTIKCHGGRIYHLSTMIERAEYIVEAILRFNAKLMPWPEFVAFRNKLVLSDHQLARFEESYYGRHSLIALFHLIILPAIYLAYLYFQQAKSMVVHSAMGHILIGLKLVILTNISLWGIYQFILKRIIDKNEIEQFQRNFKDKKRNMSYEIKLYRGAYACIVSLCLVFYSVIYCFDLNRYEFIVTLENFGNEQYAGTIHLVDTRYNCQKCNFSLKHGDVTVILYPDRPGKFLAKVVGLQDEVVKLNYATNEKHGRAIASTGERKLDEHELAARTGQQGQYITPLSEEQIHGKVVMTVASLPKAIFSELFSTQSP